MKRGILVATLMIAAAGVASANLLTTSSPGVASPRLRAQPASDATRTMTPPGADKTGAGPAPAAPVAHSIAAKRAPAPTVSASAVRKASIEARQAPVPFHLKPRPPVNLPPVADQATETNAAGKTDETSSDPAGDAASENAARAAIEADGYKGVKVLRKGTDGVWHASALRGSTTVMLTVDAGGSVSAD
jgi:hypothetical protein